MRTVTVVSQQYDGILTVDTFTFPDDLDAIKRLFNILVSTQGVIRIEILIPT